MHYLQRHFDLTTARLVGASAGALTAALAGTLKVARGGRERVGRRVIHARTLSHHLPLSPLLQKPRLRCEHAAGGGEGVTFVDECAYCVRGCSLRSSVPSSRSRVMLDPPAPPKKKHRLVCGNGPSGLRASGEAWSGGGSTICCPTTPPRSVATG